MEQFKRLQREKEIQQNNAIAAANAQKLRAGAALHAGPMSPDVRQSTPGSPPTPDHGVSMARDPSNEIASPARPPSAQRHPNGMARIPPNMGTPQAQSTPQMANVGPVRNMTPQPQMLGSPAPNNTPMMTPTNGQLTPEQQHQLNMYRNQRMMQQQMGQPGLGLQGTQLSPQQMQMMQMQRQISQGAIQNPGMPVNKQGQLRHAPADLHLHGEPSG
jgi:hypothetical protein